MKKFLAIALSLISLLPNLAFGAGLPIGGGGNGQSTYTAGDMLYYGGSSLTSLSKLGIGSEGNCLTVSGGLPAWSGSCGGGGSGTPGGASGEIQWNNAGTFDGIPELTYDGVDISANAVNLVFKNDPTTGLHFEADLIGSGNIRALHGPNTDGVLVVRQPGVTPTTGDCVEWLDQWNIVSAGAPCGSGGGLTDWNDIGDATADGAIALSGFETDWTSTLDSANKSIFTITNTDADTANDTDFIDLKHNDGADANIFYLRAIGDNDGTPTTDYLFSQVSAKFGLPVLPVTSNTYALGSSSLYWSDLFLGDGAIIDFNSDVTFTHSADAVTVAGGEFRARENLLVGNTTSSGGQIKFVEATGNGVNFKAFLAPSAITTDTTCTFENDANFIPDSCVGDGTDNTVSDGTYSDITVSSSGTVWSVNANSVALATDTTGNYVQSVTTSVLTGLTGGNTAAEATNSALAFDYSQALSGDPALGANAGVFGTSGLVFEGSSANTFETFIAITNPTADRTITVPDASLTLNAAADISGTTLASNVVTSSLTTVGALNAGSITSGFGAIDTGADNITTTGTVFGNAHDRSTAGSLTVGATNATSITLGSSSVTALTVTTDGTGTAEVALPAGSIDGTEILNDTVALTTDTSGNYVSSATASGGLVLTGTEGASLGVLLPAATDALSSTTSSGSGLELLSGGLTLLQGCSDGQILKWTESSDVWGCAADSTGGGGGSTWDTIGDPAGNGAVAMAETVQSLDWDTGAVTATAFDGFALTIQDDAATDVLTQRLLTLENKAASTQTVEVMQRILNSDTAAVTTGLLIDGNAFTTAIDASDSDIVTALSVGLNPIKFGDLGYIADANDNELFIWDTVASAVNEVTFANAATGTNPQFSATGGDSNVGLNFLTKGTGVFRFLATSSGPTDIRWLEDSDNGTNYNSLIAPASMAADIVQTLPATTGTLSNDNNTLTLQNKTVSAASNVLDACIPIAVTDEYSNLTTGTAKVTFRMPFAMTLTTVRGSLNTVATGGTLVTVDINEAGTTVISTKLTFDASEKTTTTAATPAVISDSSIADDAEMTVDIDAVGNTTPGNGLKIVLCGTI